MKAAPLARLLCFWTLRSNAFATVTLALRELKERMWNEIIAIDRRLL